MEKEDKGRSTTGVKAVLWSSRKQKLEEFTDRRAGGGRAVGTKADDI